MSFHLANQKAKLAHLNTRAQNSGPDKVSVCDLKFAVNMTSEVLAMFAPTLRAHFYTKNGDGGDLANTTHEAPNLRYPKLGPLTWSGEIIGAEVTVHYGTGGMSDIVLGSCKVNRFGIAPQEGGTCIVTFRVQAEPDEKQIGKLFGFIQRDVELSLTGPDWSEEADGGDGGGEDE